MQINQYGSYFTFETAQIAIKDEGENFHQALREASLYAQKKGFKNAKISSQETGTVLKSMFPTHSKTVDPLEFQKLKLEYKKGSQWTEIELGQVTAGSGTGAGHYVIAKNQDQILEEIKALIDKFTP